MRYPKQWYSLYKGIVALQRRNPFLCPAKLAYQTTFTEGRLPDDKNAEKSDTGWLFSQHWILVPQEPIIVHEVWFAGKVWENHDRSAKYG